MDMRKQALCATTARALPCHTVKHGQTTLSLNAAQTRPIHLWYRKFHGTLVRPPIVKTATKANSTVLLSNQKRSSALGLMQPSHSSQKPLPRLVGLLFELTTASQASFTWTIPRSNG